jgi:hypothetical protein
MARIITESIWTLSNDELVLREGRISLHPSHVFINDSDTQGPLHVTEGLKGSDLAVFLGYKPYRSERELSARSVGYLVTQVDVTDEGSGIIVSGDLIENRPQDWVTERLIGAWGLLLAEGYSPRDFDLHRLHDYLIRKNLPSSELPDY